MSFDLAIIGGGASGLSAAIEAKRESKKAGIDLNVTVFEHLNKPAKKILATGNGRCNFCNTDLNESHYFGDNDFIKDVLSSKYNDSIGFFKSMGILPYFENGRVYPRSEQATSIRDALLKTCEILNINFLTECDIEKIEVDNNKFIILDNNYDSVIIATGGNSQKSQGSDGSGYKLLKALGHKITDISPALTALTINEKSFKDLKGLRVKGNCALYSGRKLLKEEYGEIQFTENAISGIPVLNISQFANGKKNLNVLIDVCNEFSVNDLTKHFKECRYKSPTFRTEEILSGIIPQKLAYFVMKKSGIKENTLASKLTEKNIESLVLTLKQLEFKIDGVRDFDYSQVTKGGASSSDFDTKSLISKKQDGLFACGEILNVNGDCGGYNLHFAWTSGRLAGASAVKYLNNK
ncbi:MAG: aminoacetone oxidase family FAD-binding enzyme [Clostridia bacterium]|nr:aminoacetone oxidase family FAD-binding enzyme [Clostridia bacterium]